MKHFQFERKIPEICKFKKVRNTQKEKETLKKTTHSTYFVMIEISECKLKIEQLRTNNRK